MDLVVLVDETGTSAPAILPRQIRDALPQLFVEASLPLALVGAGGELLAVNSGFCALVGRTAGTLAGGRIADVVHADERVGHLAGWHALLGGLSHADRVNARLLRSDGSVVHAVLYRTVLSRSNGRDKPVGLVAVHDESAHIAAVDRASHLNEIAEQLTAVATNPRAVGAIATRVAADAVGDGAWIWTVDETGSLTVAASWHRDPGRRALLASAVANVPTRGGVLGSVLAVNRPLRLTNDDMTETAPEIAATFASYAETYGLTGLVVLPLAGPDDNPQGVLGVARDGGLRGAVSAYTDDEVSDIAALGRTTARALDSAAVLADARNRAQLVRGILDAIPVMAGVLDHTGRVLDVNAAWMRATTRADGATRSPIGQDYLTVWDAAAARGDLGAAEIANGVRAVINGVKSEFMGDSSYAPSAPLVPTGEMWLHVHATVLDLGVESPTRLIVVDHQDITDRKRLEVRLAYEATHDPLTRLPNRTLLIDRIKLALARDRRAAARTAVMFCDLDQFKFINDSYGHEVGDGVLREVARRFATTVRASDTVARIGGDEFVVLVESISDLDEALIVADKLVLSLEAPANGLPLLPGVSIGVAVSSEGATAESLLRASDATMYAVKQSGRGRVLVADEFSPS